MPRVDLEEYELHEQIGVGTVGTIYRAVHKTTGQVVAIKFLSQAAQSDLVKARFAREMMILEKLVHPNILAYYGGGEHDGQLFFVMELIKGGTLKDLVANTGTLSWEETAEVCRQIASALQHAHNHGIIHRDLKPGNVFITEEGVLKLGDFGIARDQHEQDLTEAGLTVGTYSYMPPELVRGEKDITGHVDLYALGCLMFELLTGKPPYVGDNFAQIFDQHLKSDPPLASSTGVSCPKELDFLITELLAKDPHDRPFNARAVQGYLSEMLDSTDEEHEATEQDAAAGEISAAKAKLTHRVQGQVPREAASWKTLLLLGVVIAVVIGFGVLLGGGN